MSTLFRLIERTPESCAVDPNKNECNIYSSCVKVKEVLTFSSQMCLLSRTVHPPDRWGISACSSVEKKKKRRGFHMMYWCAQTSTYSTWVNAVNYIPPLFLSWFTQLLTCISPFDSPSPPPPSPCHPCFHCHPPLHPTLYSFIAPCLLKGM